MINKVKEFLTGRNIESDVINNIGYLCQGGSHIFGTNNIDSDLDLRGIILPTEDHIIGLKKFDHLKLAEGQNSINLQGDMDVEFYSIPHFIDSLYNGHGIPAEMLFVNDLFKYHVSDELKVLFDNKDIFLSKSLAFNFLAMNKQFEYRIDIPVGNIKNPLSIKRIETHGFESKNASKAIQHLRLVKELALSSTLNFYREDRAYLLDVKHGNVELDLIKKEIKELKIEIEELLELSKLPRYPDFEKVNSLHKDLIRKFI